MELMRFFINNIIVFMLRINSYILNEPDIFYNIKKIFNMFGFPSNFGAELIPSLTIGKTIPTNQSTARLGAVIQRAYSDIFVREQRTHGPMETTVIKLNFSTNLFFLFT